MRSVWFIFFGTLGACMPSRGTRAPQSNSDADVPEVSDEADVPVASEVGPETTLVEPTGACAGDGLLAVGSAWGSPGVGEPIRVVGAIAFPGRAACVDEFDCSGEAALMDGAEGRALPLRGEDPWSCAVYHTVGGPHVFSTICAPGVLGVRYRVWGRGGPHDADLYAGVGSIDVDDYCLDTAGDALLGRYRGTLEVADATVSFTATIRLQDGRRVLAYGSPERDPSDEADRDPIPGGIVDLDIGDGYVDLAEGALYEPYLGMTNAEAGIGARLHSQRNRLVGGYTDLVKQRTVVITLDRLD